ncbi:MAG TPA: hypothetical protein VNG71_20310 [Pyrinomonadaceae bacterium]|nr:hypothetical protein [Pyrinomonadaceae bacterium]
MGQLPGKTEFVASNGKVILVVDPDSSFVQITHNLPSGATKVMELTNSGSLSLLGSGNDWGARLDGFLATLFLGREPGSNFVVTLNGKTGTFALGGSKKAGKIFLKDATGKDTIILDAATGDIIITNADCAEDFDVDDTGAEPGSVLVLSDEPGRLRLSHKPYDTRVAGVLSGAGDCRPGIVLNRRAAHEGRQPVALVGKVWCKVEAQSAPIQTGALLTTSSLPGHAMAVKDRDAAFGAVLGKALSPLGSGVGLVPVLVALQ